MKNIEVRNLKEVIAANFDEDFEIIEEETHMLTKPGEHYGSIMLAIDVKLKFKDREECKNLVAKMIPVSEMLREAFDIYVTFKKEVSAYSKAIPALIELQREYNVTKNKIIDIFPKCYGFRLSLDNNKDQVDEDALLIFENLKVQGYGMGDRFTGFDLVHAKLIVQDLAMLHAVSIALKTLKPNVFLTEVMPCLAPNYGFDRLPEDVKNAFIDSVVEVAKTMPETEPYVQKLNELMVEAFENFDKPRPSPNELFATILHDDYWVNNTMILWDENGNPIRNKIVDLQTMQYDSCVRDLLFFIFTSLVPKVINENYDELVKLYYDTFIDNLKDYNLNLKPFSWKRFLNELDECGATEFVHIALMLKPIFTEKGKVNSLDEFTTSDWSRRDLIGPNHARKLKELVLEFAKRNWL